MSPQPLVSIIMCFLNEEEFLEEAIESVLQQQYANWELFLIDDGSTDNSTAIAKSYAQKYPGKIVYGEHDGHANKGLAASRNLAIKKASGELLAFLDGDDIWLPNFLSQLLPVLQQQNAALVCEATEYWYSWNSSNKKDVVVPIGTEQNKLYSPVQLLLNLYPLGQGAAPCVCGLLVKKDILEKYGGFEEAFKGMYEDQTFLIKFYAKEHVYISSSCNNRYRQNRGSLVSASHETGMYYFERKRYLEWLERYLKQTGITDGRVRRLLFKAQLPYRYPFLHYAVYKLPAKVKHLFERLIKSV